MRASEWSDRLSFSSPSDADAARLALAKNFVFTSRRSATRPIREANYASRSADCAGYLSPRLAISRHARANIIKADYEFKPPMSDGTFKRPSSTVDTLDSILWSELSDNNVHNPSTSCLQSCVHTKDSFYDHRQSHFFFRLTVWKGSLTKEEARRVNGRRAKREQKSKLCLESNTKRSHFDSIPLVFRDLCIFSQEVETQIAKFSRKPHRSRSCT